MRISEFAQRAGVSPRALRHYEQTGLLVPRRTSTGYRDYSEDQLDTVARIRVILDAGLGTGAAREYLDCVDAGDRDPAVHMCSQLRQALRAVEERIAEHTARLQRDRDAVAVFIARSQPHPPGDHEPRRRPAATRLESVAP